MIMNILFSPIGNSDPWRNDADGAMLHIVRHYKPEAVYLFFTDSIWEGNERVRGQKEYHWKQFIDEISGDDVKVTFIHEEISAPHDFDAYKDSFHRHLNQIHEEYPNACVLLNVTSGTPQMESTLCLEYITYPTNKKCIQVATPLKSSNSRTTFATPENQTEQFAAVNQFERENDNRCKEIGILSFKETIVKNQIKELIDNYDYTSALTLLNSEKDTYRNEQLKGKLQILSDSIQKYNLLPEIAQNYKDIKLQNSLFHCLLLNLYFKRGDYANALVRVKSISEYLGIEYLEQNYPGIISYGKRIVFNENFQPFYQTYEAQNRKFVSNPINFIACINALKILGENNHQKVINLLNVIDSINDDRNAVAHRLRDIKINQEALLKAINSVEELLKIVYKDKVKMEDFDLFDKYNNDLMEII